MHVGACRHIHVGINNCDVQDPDPRNNCYGNDVKTNE